jgi:hypothetical protein
LATTNDSQHTFFFFFLDGTEKKKSNSNLERGKKRLHHKNIKCHTAQKWGLKKKGTFSSSK